MKYTLIAAFAIIGCTKQQSCEQWDVVETCQSLNLQTSCHQPTYLTISVCDGSAYPNKTIVIYSDNNAVEYRTYIQKR